MLQGTENCFKSRIDGEDQPNLEVCKEAERKASQRRQCLIIRKEQERNRHGAVRTEVALTACCLEKGRLRRTGKECEAGNSRRKPSVSISNA